MSKLGKVLTLSITRTRILSQSIHPWYICIDMALLRNERLTDHVGDVRKKTRRRKNHVGDVVRRREETGKRRVFKDSLLASAKAFIPDKYSLIKLLIRDESLTLLEIWIHWPVTEMLTGRIELRTQK